MEFVQVDVFADAAYRGNPLAVFPDAAGLTGAQMQAIASEMSVPETTFVTSASSDYYEMRIFTPEVEYPFAGHPTIGTAWTLLHLGRIEGDTVTQKSRGCTIVVWQDEQRLFFERTGTCEPDLEERDTGAARKIAAALGLDAGEVGLEAREMGRSGYLRAAWADAGLRTLAVPVRDADALRRCSPAGLRSLTGGPEECIYCFTAVMAGRLRARGLFASARSSEDPATGSAAAALGIYLADRVGPVDLEIEQGIELGRPGRISLKAAQGKATVGGTCRLVLTGRLEHLPPR